MQGLVPFDQDYPRDRSFNRDLCLIALEHNPGKGLEHPDARAWSDAERAEAIGAAVRVSKHVENHAGFAGVHGRERLAIARR
jgi:hypothetical protein